MYIYICVCVCVCVCLLRIIPLPGAPSYYSMVLPHTTPWTYHSLFPPYFSLRCFHLSATYFLYLFHILLSPSAMTPPPIVFTYSPSNRTRPHPHASINNKYTHTHTHSHSRLDGFLGPTSVKPATVAGVNGATTTCNDPRYPFAPFITIITAPLLSFIFRGQAPVMRNLYVVRM